MAKVVTLAALPCADFSVVGTIPYLLGIDPALGGPEV